MLADVASATAVVIAVFTALTAAILFFSAIFALRQLRETKNTRYAELLADLTRRWDEPLLRSARIAMAKRSPQEIETIVRDEYEGRGTPESEKIYYELQALPNFVEGIAVIQDETKGLTVPIVDRLWGSTIIVAWERWEPAVKYLQSRPLPYSKRNYRNFEELARLVKEHRERPGRVAWSYGDVFTPPPPDD